jgi:hypothetical protein
MYFVAGLFLIWALANLAGGDYVGLVVGVAVAAALGAGQYFWDALGGDGVWQRLKVPAAVAVMIAAIAVIAVMLLEEIEIGAEKYVVVEQAVVRFPELRVDARRAVSDRKISIVEYHELEKAYHRLAKRRAIETLNGD